MEDDKLKTEIKSLTEEIIKFFPKFFGDFKDYQYGNGTNAEKDIKRIFNKAKRLNTKL